MLVLHPQVSVRATADDKLGLTPLMKAVEACDPVTVRQLLTMGADWRYQLGLERATILHQAVLAGTHQDKAREAAEIIIMLRRLGSVLIGPAL